jgi:hypothetical protein
MATLMELIVVAVEDMLIDHCLMYGIPAERAVIILAEAAVRRNGILVFADHWECADVETIAEIIVTDMDKVEERLFGDCEGNERLLTERAEKAIIVFYVSASQSIGNLLYSNN